MATTGGVQDLVTPDCTLGYRPLAGRPPTATWGKSVMGPTPKVFTSPNVGAQSAGEDPQKKKLADKKRNITEFNV